ncbi:MAG TPA: FG-GAP-like repeat-containing protein [Thermoanaerobaculia bacterium]|nr:FG-GAP-like repeat-containing protein [Thermoanaerobaculia bacterium]
MRRIDRKCLAVMLGLIPAALGAQPYFDAPWRSFESSETSATTGRYLVEVATGDLDGDGLDDVLAGQGVWTGGLRVFLNAGPAEGGPATFEDPVFYPIQNGAWGVVVVDLDGDLDLDVATSDTDINGSASRVAILLNDGTGALGAATYYPAGPQGPTGITAADLDHDGDPDLAVANWGLAGFGEHVSVLLNDGSAQFGTATSYLVPGAPFRIEAGDLNGDTHPDLVVAHDDDAAVSILFGTGSGSFSAPFTYFNIFNIVNTGSHAAVALLDSDGDLDLDIAFTSSFAYNQGTNDGELALLRNDGSGAFTVDHYPYGLPYQNVAFDLAVADLNGDPYLDLVGGVFYEAGFISFLADGAGGYVALPEVASADDVIAIAAPDLDGDGDSDVATVNRLYPLMSAHENPGNGSFPRLPLFGNTFVHFVLDVGDVDNDGDIDAVTSHSGAISSTVDVYLGGGDGTFTLSYETADSIYGFAKLRHLDQDGFLDLLFVSGPSSPPYDFFTALGNGDGTFGPVVRWPVGTCGNAHPAAFDLDEDGDLDVIVTEDRGCPGLPGSGHRLFIRKNNGDGTFQPPYTVPAAQFSRNVDAGDLDEDGHLDLAVVGRGSDAILFGNGDGSFQPPVPISLSYVSDNILVHDWDQDGHLDVAALASVSTGVSAIGVLWGDGAGGFDPQTSVLHPAVSSRLVISTGDIDGDGDDDILSDGVQDLLVFLNSGGRTLSDGGRYGLGRDSRAIVFTEANGDGIGDVLAIATTEQPSSLYDGVIVLPGAAQGPLGFLVLPTPIAQTICAGEEAQVLIDVPSVDGFSESVTLTIAGAPAGTTTAFSVNPVVPTGSSILTVSATGGATPGSYDLTVTGTSAPSGIVHDGASQLTVLAAAQSAPTLLAPVNGATGISLEPSLAWTPSAGATTYFVEVDDDPGFASPAFTASVSETATAASGLAFDVHYFWRVTAIGPCAEATSPVFGFTTALFLDGFESGDASAWSAVVP